MLTLISSLLNHDRLCRTTALSDTSMTVGKRWFPLVQRLAWNVSDGMGLAKRSLNKEARHLGGENTPFQEGEWEAELPPLPRPGVKWYMFLFFAASYRKLPQVSWLAGAFPWRDLRNLISSPGRARLCRTLTRFTQEKSHSLTESRPTRQRRAQNPQKWFDLVRLATNDHLTPPSPRRRVNRLPFT